MSIGTDESGHPTPGRDYFNIHAILAQLVGLIERHHQRPTSAMQSRTLDNASQLTSKIGRCEFETNLMHSISINNGEKTWFKITNAE